MSRLPALTLAEAPELSRPALENLNQAFGRAPNLFATIAASAPALNGLLHWTGALNEGALTPVEIELINLHVSELNGCAYCVSAHTLFGKRLDLNAETLEQFRNGQGRNAREQAILNFVRRVVRTGGAGAGSELIVLREAGVGDAAVLEILAHIALKTFTNAVAIVAQIEVDLPKAPRLPAV